MPITQDKLAWLNDISLTSGNHASVTDGACVLEAVAYVAGERWSDHPACACPVITLFLVNWNDNLPSDAERDRLLKPLVPRIVGSRSTPEVGLRRSWMAFDWLVRVHTPAWLDLAGLTELAGELRTLGEIGVNASLDDALPIIRRAQKEAVAAWDAARDAAWDAARDAAWDAARVAARDAAWDAARVAARDAAAVAARDAAAVAARAAAAVAARAAAAVAARDALAPTVTILQTSALDLVDRMLAVAPDERTPA